MMLRLGERRPIMREENDEADMTDLQYKDHLRAVVADFERIKRMGVSDEAAAEIDAVIKRFTTTIES